MRAAHTSLSNYRGTDENDPALKFNKSFSCERPRRRPHVSFICFDFTGFGPKTGSWISPVQWYPGIEGRWAGDLDNSKLLSNRMLLLKPGLVWCPSQVALRTEAVRRLKLSALYFNTVSFNISCIHPVY